LIMKSETLRSFPEAYDENYYRSHHGPLSKYDLDTIPSFYWSRELLNAGAGDIVLDAGTGIGYLLNYLCEPGIRGVGVDFSPAALRLAKKEYAHLDFFREDLGSLSFKDNSFDRILCYNVIEHMRDQERLLRELHRVLKPGGMAVIGTNMKYSVCNLLYKLLIRDHTHENELTVARFRRRVGEYFQVESVRKSSCVYRFPPAINRVFHCLLRADIIIQARK
jgi:SAM-dependent methyltransferase